MICSRFIKPGTRQRLLIRGCTCDHMIHIEVAATQQGFIQVGIVKYLLHRVLGKRVKA